MYGSKLKLSLPSWANRLNSKKNLDESLSMQIKVFLDALEKIKNRKKSDSEC
jgi:hypothetical protein